MPDDKPPSRRDRRVASRKEQILDAAAHLFARKGFHRTTTKDIAEAADIAEGTLYNYFENKDDLLFGIMSHLVKAQDLENRLDLSVEEDPRKLFHAILHERKTYIDEYDDLYHSILSEILVNPDLRQRYYDQIYLPSMDQLEGHIRARQKIGQFQPVEPALASRFMMAVLVGLYFMDVIGDPIIMQQWEELSDVIVKIFFDGMGDRS